MSLRHHLSLLAALFLVSSGCALDQPAADHPAAPPPAAVAATADALAPPRLAAEPARVPCDDLAVDTGLLKIHFLNVRQGDCTFIECPNGQTILFDCGIQSTQTTDMDALKADIQSRLKPSTAPGFTRSLDLLLISHPDHDHYTLLPYVLAGVEIKKAVIAADVAEFDVKNRVPPGSGLPRNPLFAWLTALDQRGVLLRLHESDFDPLNAPSSLCACGDADLFVLAADVPPTRRSANFKVNTRSIVLLVRLGDVDVLLTADATYDTEKKITDRYLAADPAALRAEVLKVGHHGSDATSTSDAWAVAVSPRVAVISAGHKFDHPRIEVVERLAAFTDDDAPPHKMEMGAADHVYETRADYTEAIYCTCTNGDILLQTDGANYCLHADD